MKNLTRLNQKLVSSVARYFRKIERERSRLSKKRIHPAVQIIILSRYWVHIALILFVANVAILRVLHLLIFSQSCMTTEQIAADSRCLYILGNKYYEKGTRSSPHQRNPCGTDVTQLIQTKSFHMADTAFYLDPNYRGEVCSAYPTPPPAPTPTPYVEPTPPPAAPTPPPESPDPTPAATPPTGGNNLWFAPTPRPRPTPKASPVNNTPSASLALPSIPPQTGMDDTGFGGLIAYKPPDKKLPNDSAQKQTIQADLYPSPSPVNSLVQITGSWSRVISYAAFGSVIATGLIWLGLTIFRKVRAPRS